MHFVDIAVDINLEELRNHYFVVDFFEEFAVVYLINQQIGLEHLNNYHRNKNYYFLNSFQSTFCFIILKIKIKIKLKILWFSINKYS